jgi:hypothetical protein
MGCEYVCVCFGHATGWTSGEFLFGSQQVQIFLFSQTPGQVLEHTRRPMEPPRAICPLVKRPGHEAAHWL